MILFGQSQLWVGEVLDVLEARIADVTGLPRDKVFAYAGEPEDLCARPRGDKFITTWFTNLPPDMASAAGGGSAYTVINSTPRIDVFARVGTDKELADARLLKDKSLGYGELVRKTVKAFHIWSGSIDGATSPFTQPPRLAPAGVTFNPRKPPTGWAWARVAVLANWRADLT